MTKQHTPLAEGTVRKVKCPTCRDEVVWDTANRYRPFCSERCKLMDMGAWAAESYRVAGSEDTLSESGDMPKNPLF